MDYYVIEQVPDRDGYVVVYGRDLTLAQAEALAREIEQAGDGRSPLVYDYLPAMADYD